MRITPKVAYQLLRKIKKNACRKINEAKVKEITEEIKAGEWKQP